MNPTPHIIPSALLLLAAFLIGCLIGYGVKRLFGSRRPSTPASDTPANGRPDDLKKIKGIGPKLESVLHENGVHHFHQIAAWNTHTVATMNERLSFGGRIEREEWVSQARALDKAERR